MIGEKLHFKGKDFYMGEKLHHASSNGNQLSVALPAWMKDRLKEMKLEKSKSISRIIIEMLERDEEFNTNNKHKEN
jgi:hypothetical protein